MLNRLNNYKSLNYQMSTKILNQQGGGLVNYNDLWSTSVTDSSYNLLHNYTYRSGTAMDFVYLRYNGTLWMPASTSDLGVLQYANVKYFNNIPINSSNHIDLRCNSNSVYIFCYTNRFVNSRANRTLNVRIQLKFTDGSNVTVNNPIVYYKVNSSLTTSISMVKIFDNLHTKIWNKYHIYLSESCNLNQITFFMLRVNLSGYVTNPTDTLYFKENIDKQTSTSTEPVMSLKTYITYSKVPYNGAITSSYAVIGQNVTDGSYTANINNTKMMYQTAFLIKVAAYCENTDEAGPIQINTINDTYIQRNDGTSNTRVFYMAPMYRNLGCNYSWLPMCYPVDITDKLRMYGGFDITGSYVELETFAGIANTEINNNSGSYSVTDKNTCRNLYTIDSSGCNRTYTPYSDNPTASRNIFQLQQSEYAIYLSFSESSDTPAETPWPVQRDFLSPSGSKLMGFNYNWNQGKFIFYDTTNVMLFINYTITSSSEDNYIDATVQITFEPMSGSDYSTTVPTFADNLTVNMDIIRYIDFGYTSDNLNLSSDDFFMMGKLTNVTPSKPYVGFINVINNANAKIHFNNIKLLLLAIQT